jgi:hypothetical protein
MDEEFEGAIEKYKEIFYDDLSIHVELLSIADQLKAMADEAEDPGLAKQIFELKAIELFEKFMDDSDDL